MPRSPSTDLSRLRRALESGIPAPVRANSRSVVDIGCGRCDECNLLLELFPIAALTLVDIDRTNIDVLMRRLRSSSPRVRLVHGDARQLGETAPGPFDLALIRHPDIDAQPEVWETTLCEAVEHLTPAGNLILLTYTTAEAEVARKIIQSLPVREITPHALFGSPVALAGNDRYILMCSRL